MPRREDIERFTQILNSLGDEPAIRAARSEAIQEVVPPGEEPASQETDELDSLSPDEAAGGGAGEQENLQDLFDSLSALPDAGATGEEGGPTPSGATTADKEPAEEPSAEGLDFASLFGEGTEAPAIEELERPAPRPAEPAGGEPQAEEEAFSFPGGEPENLQADLSQLEVLPEEADLAAPSAGEEAPATEPGAEAFEDLGAFPLEQPEPGAPETPIPDEQAGAPAEAESFELPNLDDLSFAEPGEAPEVPPEPAAPSTEEMPPLEGFDLDAAPLDLGGAPEAVPGEQAEAGEAPAAAPGGIPAAAAEPAMENLGEESLGDINLDEFSLPESAEQFGMPPLQPEEPAPKPTRLRKERPAPEPKRPRPAPRMPAPPAPPTPETGYGEGEAELTPEQFARLKKTLESLPRNLKIAVQDLIGQGTVTGADLTALIGLLLRGATAQEIATLAGRISGKRIRIPAGYEKKSGVAFEAEQRTFAYAFRENFLPLLRVVLITMLAGGLFGYLGYNYVYRPLSASTNYRVGYAQIANDRFALANERFDRATRIWPMKKWYYRYAEGFAAKRQYVLAEKKYDELLKEYPGDKKGILDYARMESTRLADYQKADTLLKLILDKRMYDYEAMLAAGDNNLEWAEQVREKYEGARLAYATLIERYGAKDELLLRMLRLFIRTNNGDEVERLRAFYASRPEVKIDAAVFAELGGYLLDHRRLDFVQDVLFRADTVQPGLYLVHYNLARYYRLVQNQQDEKKALDVTVRFLDRTKSTDALTRARLAVEIDTHARLGEYSYRTREYITAEKELQTAIRLVEQNQGMKLIGRERMFGRPYAALGDLYYYIQGDLALAAQQYQNAIDNGYTSAELVYKIGFTQYARQDFKAALGSFAAAENASLYPRDDEEPAPAAEAAPALPQSIPGMPPQNLLYALGVTFFQRGDYFAAQGYFLTLLDRLSLRRANLGILHPEDKPEDRALMEAMVKVNNNLGVTMIRLAERMGDRKKRSEGMVYLSMGDQLDGALASSPGASVRTPEGSVPFLNMRDALRPVPARELQIFKALPRDFSAISW